MGFILANTLCADLQPFLGGTYFPPQDAFGRPGFPTVLGRVSEVWRTKQSMVQEQTADVMRQLQQHTQPKRAHFGSYLSLFSFKQNGQTADVIRQLRQHTQPKCTLFNLCFTFSSKFVLCCATHGRALVDCLLLSLLSAAQPSAVARSHVKLHRPPQQVSRATSRMRQRV